MNQKELDKPTKQTMTPKTERRTFVNQKELDKPTKQIGTSIRRPRYLIAILLSIIFVFGCKIAGCSTQNYLFSAHSKLTPGASNSRLAVYLDIDDSGVYTPTYNISMPLMNPATLAVESGSISVPMVNELSDKGYLAVRVPHAPPTYTQSNIISATIDFTYYEPPDAANKTTVPVTITQRNEYLAAVNARYPITDGKSHWEIWGLPAGERFPVPNGAFRLKGGWPTALEVYFELDFSAGVPAVNCAGCPVEVLLYNGYTYIGPFTYPLVIEENPPPVGNPLVAFGPRCGALSTVQSITPTVPFTHTHWLESYDTVTRTFTINTSSSQSWGYTYYTKRPGQPAMVPVAGAPFTVTTGPRPTNWPFADCIGIMAVNTPTISISGTMRETFAITATSVVSPDVQAAIRSFALAPSYQLNEGGGFSVRIFLPVLMK